ncbi:caspase family protein [Pyxidicoccus fallax]|uniref:Caspase family protein n=1 Tax=Pyxidicoccus fallax TaxID=394095 RepID=A0A848LW84_9BACT|nr:caspase family protein [Pyxidicoccus fallax]NMO21880.1 caspase family protein [Pyxidicoccus fallax]NPC83490.1 caspase family protein [Pyxidicoccus fallax]
MTLALLLAAMVAAQPVAVDAGPRRFALAVGNNRGMGADAPLRYAERDAVSVLGVLREAGGLRREDSLQVLGTDADAVRDGLARFERHLQAHARPGDQLFVYVSSHADAGELHLSGTRLPLREVVRFIESAPVSVAVLVVDSCQSGEAARLKGLKPLPGVLVNMERPELAGRVIITASAADESAQESDALAGSIFTHHLVAALRGAADVSGDGRVTLAEAYTYSYARTVESSLLSRAGTQHPTFHFDLQGKGDLVLSSPARATSLLTLAIDEPGDWTVSTLAGEPVLGHVRKGAGAATLALPAGGYILSTRSEHTALVARVHVPDSGRAELTRAQLRPQKLEAHVLKGASPSPSPWMVHVGPGVGRPLLRSFGTMVGGTAALQHAWTRPGVNLLALTLDVRHGRHPSGDLRQNDHGLRLGVGRLVRDWHGLHFQLTLDAGATLSRQWQPSNGDTRLSLQPQLGVGAGVWLPLRGALRVSLLGNVGHTWVHAEAMPASALSLGGSLGIGWVR